MNVHSTQLLPEDGSSISDVGYKQRLTNRHMNMMAIGGSIGTGLFLGTGQRLHSAGPVLFIVFIIAGIFSYFILLALKDLIIENPSSGSFIAHTYQLFGPKLAYIVGWIYLLLYMSACISGMTASALYLHYWPIFQHIPQWVLTVVVFALVLGVNLCSVAIFGELEFFFGFIKVAAIVAFIITGIIVVCSHHELPVQGRAIVPGMGMWSHFGGIAPHGISAIFYVVQGAVFSYVGIELLGSTADEVTDAKHMIPRAIRTVLYRMAIFYVGSVFLLSVLLPYFIYKSDESPFVTFLGYLFPGRNSEIFSSGMNFVVLTAAISEINVHIYVMSRIVRFLCYKKLGPQSLVEINSRGIPAKSLGLITIIALLGVLANAVLPADAFNLMINLISVAVVVCWAMIVINHIRFSTWVHRGIISDNYLSDRSYYSRMIRDVSTLLFLVVLAVLVSIDYTIGTYTVLAFVCIIIPALAIGWMRIRKNFIPSKIKRSS